MSNPLIVPHVNRQPIYDEATGADSQSRLMRRMRPFTFRGFIVRLLFLAGIMPMVGLAGMTQAETGPPAAPLLRIPAPVQDLGQLIRGESGLATFELANRGTAPLKILRVKPG